MVTPMAPTNKTRLGSLALLAVFGTALLAGCAGFGGDDGNRAPQAVLEADREKGWVGDEFTFDAQSSSDPDGNVTTWEFDFGDGTKQTVTDDDAARVKHAYTDGGEYVVTVKVIDDGTQDGLGEKTDEESVRVAVDDRSPVATQVVRAPLNTSAGSRMAVPFDVNEGADRAKANLTLQNTLPAGASQVLVRILDPSGKVLEEQSVSLPDTSEKDIELSTPLEAIDNHTLELVAESGSARVTGEIQRIYSEMPDADRESDEQDD